MKFFSSKWRVAVAALVLLALFLLRPGAARLKSQIILSLSAGVGRPVDLGSVHIRLLPRPGFDLENLVVYDDPAFGAEPMLRASEVAADLRLTALARGRLEIARLDLTEPSLNLVHNQRGRWNLEALLERTARSVAAPTGKAKSAPAFPYIEVNSGRINFKNGPEKKPYALINADFSLWQDSENSWGVRLKAQPVRTDLNLNDTGLLQVEGTWQRAASFRETPVQLDAHWTRAQLGQVTKFLTGNDKGWRGGIQLDLALAGTPEKLRVTSTASVEDFRRYDITSGGALRLAGRCDGEYSSVTHDFRRMKCSAPVAKGLLRLAGDWGLPGSQRYAVEVTAEDIPASALVLLAQHAKQNLPQDLQGEGLVRGKLSMSKEGESAKPRFEGQGEIADFHLSSAENKAELGPEPIPFVLVNDDGGHGASRRRNLARADAGLATPAGARIEFGPILLGSGHTPTSTARGWIARGGYSVVVAGEMEIATALRLGRMMGTAPPARNVEGVAKGNLQVGGPWAVHAENGTGFAGPQIAGSAKLRNVRAALLAAGGIVDVQSADVQFTADAVHVTKLNARAAGATWTGSLEVPRGCATPQACAIGFTLNTPETSLTQLNEWAGTNSKRRPWYRVLDGSPASGASLLAGVHAAGRLTADRFRVHTVTATRLSASLNLADGKLEISELDADLFGGRHRGEWQADFSVKPALCSGSGSVYGVTLSDVADAMKDRWIAGTGQASYEVKGPCSAEFWQAAEGTVHAGMRDGVLSRVSVHDEEEPLRVTRLDGQAILHEGRLEIGDAKLESPDGEYRLTGRVSLKREVNLKLGKTSGSMSGQGYAITGTLAAPRVAPLTGTEQARLKR